MHRSNDNPENNLVKSAMVKSNCLSAKGGDCLPPLSTCPPCLGESRVCHTMFGLPASFPGSPKRVWGPLPSTSLDLTHDRPVRLSAHGRTTIAHHLQLLSNLPLLCSPCLCPLSSWALAEPQRRQSRLLLPLPLVVIRLLVNAGSHARGTQCSPLPLMVK